MKKKSENLIDILITIDILNYVLLLNEKFLIQENICTNRLEMKLIIRAFINICVTLQ